MAGVNFYPYVQNSPTAFAIPPGKTHSSEQRLDLVEWWNLWRCGCNYARREPPGDSGGDCHRRCDPVGQSGQLATHSELLHLQYLAGLLVPLGDVIGQGIVIGGSNGCKNIQYWINDRSCCWRGHRRRGGRGH